MLNYRSGQSQDFQKGLMRQIKTLHGDNKLQQNADFSSTSQKFLTSQNQNYFLTQYEMITKQNEFLQRIKEEINKKKSNNNEILFCGSNPTAMDIIPIDSSFDVSNISGVQIYDDEPFKTKFGEQFQKSLLASALNQVNQNCSSQTYEVIRNCVLNSKQRQFQSATDKLNKLTKKYEELQTAFIIKSTLLAQTETQLKDALSKIQTFDEQKKKIKLKSDQLSEKQKRVFKLQSSIIFKEKLLHEGKKRYEREKNLFLSIQQRLNQLYNKMQQIWQQVVNKMDKSNEVSCLINCSENGDTMCWKKQVMRKCKQQLIEQRQLLRQQEEEIERQFEMIQSLSQQVKNMLNEKEVFGNSDSFGHESGSLIVMNK